MVKVCGGCRFPGINYITVSQGTDKHPDKCASGMATGHVLTPKIG